MRRESKLPLVRTQSESSSGGSTGREQENQQEQPRTSSSTTAPAPLTGDREVFPAWIRERKDFQVFFPRFSDHVVTDEEILQQGVPKEPSERNIVELQCIARWIMKIPSMSTFLDLNQATEIAKLAKYRAFRPHEYVFRKGDVGDACYLVLSGEVYILIDGQKVASVTKNAAFGDIALQLENATRGADVQAAPAGNVTPSPGNSSSQPIGCEVLMIMAEDYHKTLARCQTRRRKHLVNWLHTEVTLFRDCVESKLHFFELVSIDVPLQRGRSSTLKASRLAPSTLCVLVVLDLRWTSSTSVGIGGRAAHTRGSSRFMRCAPVCHSTPRIAPAFSALRCSSRANKRASTQSSRTHLRWS